MKSDIEIARSIELKKIKQVAEGIGIPREEVENYGRYIAKIPEQLIDEEKVKKSNLILVTAITATKAGIGKTTVSIGLALGLNKIGKKAIVALREPSLGPCFGMKGGAAGGGYAQVLPMEKINLHFTGDFHAITSAHNMISALLDNLAAAIVIMAVLRKLVPDRTDRLKYACMVIIAANAGGSWSPIGDVTTILLWVGKNVTAMHQISHVFFPALINLLVPLTIANFWLFKKDATLRVMSEEEMADEYAPEIPNHSRRVIFVIGVLSFRSFRW